MESSKLSLAVTHQFPPFARCCSRENRVGSTQPRCLAVRALAALEAYDVLIEYLNAPREVADPVERVGEDAVINAAAYALAGLHEERILELLLKLAEILSPA